MGVLQSIADREVERVAIRPSELEAKEQFRLALLQVLRKALASDGSRPLSSNDLASVRLTCFGSTGSGFATKNSDMDLTLTLPTCKTSGDVSCSPVPVLLERTLLHAGYGARLLTNTRVPIIKVCEQPTSDLLAALRGDQPGTKDVKLSKDSMVTLDSIVHRLIQRIKNQPSVSLKGDITTVASLEESLLDQLDFFKQGPDDDLTHYYRRAKDLLHQMGGRDLSLHQTEALNDGQHYILDAVIRQFAGGLRDPQVRAMLLTHKPFELANVHNESARSLWAAWIYAEIHRLVQAYRRRTIIDTDRRRVQEAATLIQEWDLLGQQRCIDHTSLMRKLDKIHKRLTAIPSLQLCLLTQRADEDAKRYAQRARLLLCRTLGVDANDRSPVLENHFLGQVNCFLDLFMHSLSDDTIRKDLTARRPAGGWQSLDEFFANHAALSRLKGYRDGLARGLFDKSAAQAVAARLAVIDRSKVMLSTSRIHRILDELHSFPSPDGQHSYPSTFKHGRAAEFPKDGIGIQCDINFSNELAILNTRLLKCYSLCDPRVTSFVLFIKSWTKRRNINTPYHGTLSSYGYVLMALHFLMNVASPAVIPNLQLMHAERGVPPDPTLDTCNGYDTRFFRDENALRQMAAQCKLTQNKQTVGELLLGFFAYFAGERRQGSFGFDWGSAVLSLRTRGGLLTKQAKGWTAAKITYVDVPPSAPLLATGKPRNPLPDSNEPAAAGGDHTSAPPDALEDQQPQPPAKKGIRHRYLIAIEDPFELEHNVGRTVLHPGLIVIRDEFRRAWRIIQGLGMGTGEDELLAVAKGGVEGGEATGPKKGGSGVGGGGAS